MYHWANKIGSWTEDDVFNPKTFYPDPDSEDDIYSIHYEDD